MRFKNYVVVVAAVVSLLISEQSAAANQTPAANTDAESSIDELIAQRMSEGGMVGLGAAIIVNKKVVWSKGYGFADKEHAVPFTTDTVMNIGSISKTFTGVALMRAVQEKKLSLDEDINKYLPFKVTNPFFPKDRMTLRQLATHTSGITDRQAIYDSTYHWSGDSPESLGAFLQSYFTSNGKYYSQENFLNVKPGTHRGYSNIAAGLAGYIVERVVGEKLNVYTKRHIFKPLKMNNTGWFLSEVPAARHAKLYVSQVGLSIPIPLYGITTYPDGGVRTSVADLSKLFLSLLNEGEREGVRILEKESAREMLRFQYTEANKPDNVNIQGENSKNSAIFWQSYMDVTRMGHGGSDPGLRTQMLTDLSGTIGVILFTNTSFDDEGTNAYFAIFNELWKYGETLRDTESRATLKRTRNTER